MSTTPIACVQHNHRHCINSALLYASQLCSERNLRLTRIRHQVLELIWQSHKPLGAYALIAMLGELNNTLVAPPTVYRALDFLVGQGLVHRIASLNAFIGCDALSPHGQHHFLICKHCLTTVEIGDQALKTATQQAAALAGFTVEEESVEIAGLCANCGANNRHD